MPPLRKISWGKIAVAYLLVLIIGEIWWVAAWLPERARDEWRKTREELAAKGESLSVSDFVPPALPDAENFFADPLWNELSDRVSVQNNGMTVHKARMPADRWQIGIFDQPPTEDEREKLQGKFPEFTGLDWTKTRVKLAREVWKKKDNDEVRAAEFVREVLSPLGSLLLRLRVLGTRPDAVFPLAYGDGMAIRMEHAKGLLSMAQALEMQGSAALALGLTEAAKEDALLIFRLAEAIRREPVLISVLVRVAVLNIGLDLLVRGLDQRIWRETDLRALDHLLADLDLPPSLAKALRFERASMVETTFPWVENTTLGQLKDALGLSAEREKQSWPNPFFRLYHIYCLPVDKAFYCRSIQAWVEALDAVPARGMRDALFPNPVRGLLDQSPSRWTKFQKLLSLLSLPGLDGSLVLVAKAQNRVSQARIAIALERYRMANGRFPTFLEALSPEYLLRVPDDLVTQEPFRYLLSGPDHFTLWSIGWDERDDGARPGRKNREGDWVWAK